MSLQFTHVRSFAWRGRLRNLRVDCSVIGLLPNNNMTTKRQRLISIRRRVASWCQIWQILPKLIIFPKISNCFWQYFHAKILPFLEISFVSIDKAIHFGLFIKWIPKLQRVKTTQRHLCDLTFWPPFKFLLVIAGTVLFSEISVYLWKNKNLEAWKIY